MENKTDKLELLDLILKESKIGIWDYDLTHDKLTWDERMFEMFGISKDEFLGKFECCKKCIHPDDVAKTEQEVGEAIQSKSNYDSSFRIVMADKSIRHIGSKAVIQYDDSGNAIRMLGINWDNTQNKLNDESVVKSIQSQLFIDQAPSALAMVDNEMRYLAASSQWCQDYKLNKEEIIGKSHYEIFPEIGEKWKSFHQDSLKGKINKRDEDLFIRADGTKQWLRWEVRPWYAHENKVGGLIMHSTDITIQKEHELKEKKWEAILDKTAEISRIGAWEVKLEPDLQLVWSKVTKEIHEVGIDYEPNLETGINFYAEGKSRNTITEVVGTAMEEGKPYDVELELVTAKNNPKWVRAIGIPERKNGKTVRLYGIFQDLTEKRDTRKQLEYNSYLLQNVSEAIISTNTDFVIQSWNRAAEILYGWSAEEAIGNPVLDLIKQEFINTEDTLEIANNTLLEKGYYQNEVIHYARDGQSLNIWSEVSLLKDENGNKVGTVGVNHDITRRKKAEEALKESEAKYRTLFELSDDAIMTLNSEEFISCNQSTIDLFGYESKEEFLGKHPGEMSPEFQLNGIPSREAANEKIATAYKVGKNLFEWIHQKKNGQSFPADVLLTPMNIDGQEVLQAIVRDISTRKKTEEEVLFKNALLEAQSEASIDGILVVDDQNKVTSVNTLMMKMWNIPEEVWNLIDDAEILPYALAQLKYPDEFMEKLDYLYTNKIENSRDEIEFKDGKYFDRYSSPLIDANKKYHGRVWYYRDITERKQAEVDMLFKNALLEAQSEASIDGIIVVNDQQEITFVNTLMMQMWDLPEEMWAAGDHSAIVPRAMELLKNPEEFTDRLVYLEKNRTEESRDEIELKDGRVYDRYSSPLVDSNKRYHGRVWYFRDMTDRKKSEEVIIASLDEKEVLLKEIHHRVKNNLQIVWGLLDIQEKRSGIVEIKAALKDSKARVNTMALIHENLYQGKDLAHVDLGKYLDKLLQNIRSIYLDSSIDLEIKNNIEGVEFGLDTTIPIALIINELVTNVYKHAFIGKSKGRVTIDIEKKEKLYILCVRDNGIGFPDGFDVSNTNSLGVRLVQNLCRQLDATSFFESNKGLGSTIEIKFHGKD